MIFVMTNKSKMLTLLELGQLNFQQKKKNVLVNFPPASVSQMFRFAVFF